MAFTLQHGVSDLIKTACVEKVMAPTVMDLYHALLLCETGMACEQFDGLEDAAQHVMEAVRNLTAMASRLVEELRDDITRKEMETVTSFVTASGEHLLLAAQKLNIEPHDTEHKEELFTSAQNVLLGVLKVLLLEDDATMREVVSAAHHVLGCLSHMEAALDIQSLLKAFQDFSDALLLLNQLSCKKAKNLLDPSQREHVTNLLETLKKCVSMLYTALLTTVKHPHSTEGEKAKKYVLGHVHITVMHLLSSLENKCCANNSCQRESYSSKIQSLLKSLAISSFQDSSCNSLLNYVIVYCMAVAKNSRKKFKKLVVDNCQDVLHLWSKILKVSKLLDVSSNHEQHLQHNIDDLFILLKNQLQKLDQSTVTALLFQVIDEFVSAKVTSDDLLMHIGQALNRDLDGRLKTFEHLFPTFLAHTDKVIQVTRFVSSLSTDVKVLKNIENSTVCLKRLKIAVASQLSEKERISDCSVVLKALQELCLQWTEETSFLSDVLSDIVDVKEFTSLAVQELENERCNCQNNFELNTHVQFNQHAIKLVGCMNLVIQFVKRHINKSDNPVYRNGLLVLVKQVEASLAEVKASMRHVLGQGLDMELFTIFCNKTSIACEDFHILCNGLNGLQHPHLLSPLREEVRRSPVVLAALPTQHLESPLLEENETADILANSVKDSNSPSQTFAVSLKKAPNEPFVVCCTSDGNQRESAVISNIQIQTDEDFGILPPLKKVLKAARKKDMTAVNVACTEVLELSNCYMKAVKMVVAELDTEENLKLEQIRTEVMALTFRTIQTAQEVAMSSAMSTKSICKEAVVLSDRISELRQVLLPAAGTWYHTICAVFQGRPETTMANKTQQVNEVMYACAELIQLVASSEPAVRNKQQDCIIKLHIRLKESQASAEHLAGMALLSSESETFEGPCVLWSLSIQVLMNLVDKILGAIIEGNGQFRTHQLSVEKRLAAISENSLRIQEASRLSLLHCRNKNTVKMIRDLQHELKSVTESYLQAAHELFSVPFSDILKFSRTEFLQRKCQYKVNALSGLLYTINKEYADAIQIFINLAISASADYRENEVPEARWMHFEKFAELLLQNVNIATQKVQDCLDYVKDHSTRVNLKFTNEHLVSQMSDIVSRARKINESHSAFELLSLEVQMHCWSAKAHVLVEEICKIEGLHWRTKEHIRLGLQGKQLWDTVSEASSEQPEESRPSGSGGISWKINSAPNVNNQEQETLAATEEHPKVGVQLHMASRSTPSLTYTSLLLKRETDKWDVQNNYIVQVTNKMSEKIHHMAQYLRKRGPIENKEALVNTAKDVMSDSRSLTQFIRVIADYCLDMRCKEDLIRATEQIQTITNELTVISRVNALTPGCKSSNEILVKNTQSLFYVVLQGIKAAETACIKGLKQPDPDSDGAEAAALFLQWKRNLLIHRAQQNAVLKTDDLGLRKVSQSTGPPSLAAPIHTKEVCS